MQYLLAVYGDERAVESMPSERMTEIISAYMAIPRPCATPRCGLGPID
jgi:hypothetical protein